MKNRSSSSPLLLSTVQILYANEGESKKEPEFPVDPLPIGEKSSYICHKGHEFIPTLYHFPTNCEACTKPLWNMFKPPPALECRRCHIKCHKDHMDKKEEIIAPCKGGQLHVHPRDEKKLCDRSLLNVTLPQSFSTTSELRRFLGQEPAAAGRVAGGAAEVGEPTGQEDSQEASAA